MSFSTPNYGLLRGLPQPDPIGSALGAYQAVQKNARANEAMQLEQEKNIRENKAAELAQQQNIRANKATELSQKLGAMQQQKSQMELHNAKRAIHDTRLADIHEASEGQKEGAYQNYRKEMTSLGANTDQLPLHYNKAVEAEAKTAYQKSALGLGDRKYVRDMAMQKLKDADAVQIAQAKATTTAATQETAYQKAQGKQLSDDVTTINTASQEAQSKALPMWNEIGSLVKKVYTGPGIGRIDLRSSDAQRLSQLITIAQGSFIKTFHLGRMTQYEFKLLQKATGTPMMYASVLSKIVRSHQQAAHEAIEQQQFANNYVKQGGRSTIEMSNAWVKELGNRRQADLEHTAKVNNMTVAQVKQKLGM